MTLFIGNLIALLGSFVMVYSGTIKDKKGTIFVQSIQIALLATSNIVLGGISGFIINSINLIRNIISYKNLLNIKMKIIISIISIILTLVFNKEGLIGYLPLISTLIFTWFMTIKDIIKFKYALAISVFLWLIYDFSIRSYTASLFDAITVVVTLLSIIKIKNKRR